MNDAYERLEIFIFENYGLTNLVSCQIDNKILYFTEWRKPFVEFEILPGNQVVATELFDKVPGSLTIKKKVG